MAKFRRGAEAIIEASQRSGGGKFTPTMQFESGETKYIQILMPMEDIPTVLMHQFIIVGQREDGNPIYERFISRKDPALDGPEGYDELIDRFDQQPTQRCVALAVELTPIFKSGSGKRKTIEGFDIEERQFERDGETVTVPAFGLVIESPYIFFNHLASYDDVKPIEETVFAVKVSGKSKDKAFTFIDTNEDPLDVQDLLDEFTEEFDLDEWLENLADEDRMRELVGSLDDDATVSRYPSKKRKGKSSEDEDEKPRARRSTRTRRKAEEDPEEEVEENEEEDEEPETKVATRNRRFENLRTQTAGKSKAKAKK